ncbi:MAG TPA: hypothetical protein VFH34_01035 [Anaerolineales bacterium]|nr:hypothetical protein [Anaerolineales bacterium]
MRPDNPIRNLDPRKLAHYEKENYVAYYQRDWLKLLRVSVGMVKESFGLSLPQAVYGAYLIARAEMAFAPFPENDIPLTEAYVRRFYEFLRKVHKEDLNVERAVKLEVNWWSVHRKLFGNYKNQELVDALTCLYEEIYGAESDKFKEAAYYRALGMLYSDLWVNEGKPADSPLLVKEEEALYEGYRALREAINN